MRPPQFLLVVELAQALVPQAGNRYPLAAVTRDLGRTDESLRIAPPHTRLKIRSTEA